MLEDITTESTCCSCLTTQISQDYAFAVIEEEEYRLVTSSATAEVDGNAVNIDVKLSFVHVDLNHPLEIEMYAELIMTASDAEDNPLLGSQYLDLVGSGPLGIVPITGQNGQQDTYHYSGYFKVQNKQLVAPFTIQASGTVAFDIEVEGNYYQLDYPATAELKVNMSCSAGSTQAGEQSPSLSQPPEAPNDERPAPDMSGKRKRSSSSPTSSSSEVDLAGGVRCTVCLDSLDAILEAGRSLHASRCGHLMCSECVQECEEQALCRRCHQQVDGVRKLYGV